MRISALALMIISLSACTTKPEITRLHQTVDVPKASCEAASNPVCAFFNAPLVLLTKPVRMIFRTETFYPTANDLKFVDSKRQNWIAPKGTITDGASIPRLFVPLIGSPTSDEFVHAAAIHDAYCGVGNNSLDQFHADTWQNVHRMFYDALRVGGTPPAKAKIMFAAVYLGGPRWYTPIREQRKTQTAHGLNQTTRQAFAMTSSREDPTNQQLINELLAAIEFIEETRPTIAQLERYLIKREVILRSHTALKGDNDGPLNVGDVDDVGYPGYP